MYFFAFGINQPVDDAAINRKPTAFVSCWINDERRDVAEVRAREFLAQYGWKVVKVLDAHPIRRDDYAKDSNGLQHYEQALLDDEVAVIYVPRKRQRKKRK